MRYKVDEEREAFDSSRNNMVLWDFKLVTIFVFLVNHFPVTTGCHDDSFKGNEARVVSIGFRQFTYSSNDLSSSKCSSTFLKVPVAP